ncbi:MAG: Hsp70 family protein [Pseudomonadota bacterium]
MSEVIIGIDLGTTNSEVAVVRDGKVTIIDDNGDKILPSVVGLSDSGTLLVGEIAKNQYVLCPEKTILSIKRNMGSQEKVNLGDSAYAPQEVSAMILKQLKSMAEDYLQCSVSKAVITVPAYFSDAQRQATREAGELAGLEVVRIINEPTAAALAYGATDQEKKNILVYDLGGGTFDVSVVCLESQVVEVLATTGNNNLGGDDFDTKIVKFIEDHLQEKGIDISQSLLAKARIQRAAEIAKIKLSDHPFAMIEEEYLLDHEGKPYHLSLEISRKEYQEMIMAHVDETLDAVHQALDEANLMASQIDEVLLVGGSTRTPIIPEKLSEIFENRPHAEIDPEFCVAIGAAIQAGVIAGEECDAVLVDITPYTFGTCYLGVLDGYPYPNVYQPLIQKNTPIPVTKSDVFYTNHDNQEIVDVSVYQGENADALQNIEIGKFLIEGLSKVPAGNPIIVDFNLDSDGILHVTAKEKRSDVEKSLTIDNAISQFTDQEFDKAKQRIDQLFADDSDDISYDEDETDQGRLVLIDKRTNTLELIAIAEGILNKVSNEDREDLQSIIEETRGALDIDDEQNLENKTKKLSDIVSYLEVSAA